MTVQEVIQELQKLDPHAEVYRCWYEINESGTCWDTGDKVSRVQQGIKDGKQHVELW